MNCPVCNRNNAVTLSICPSCGAMIHDSVREELVPKISNGVKRLGLELKDNKLVPSKPVQTENHSMPSAPAVHEPSNATSELAAKQTSPTLVEFHNKNAAVPEWRLQLQNVVRQRQERDTGELEIKPAAPAKRLSTNGATALKAEPVAQVKPPIAQKNSTLNSALERIEKSRQQFLEEQKPQVIADIPPSKANKNYPFYIAGKKNDADAPRSIETAPKMAEVNAPATSFAKPKLASSLRTEKEKLDTNKLPPLPISAPIATSFENSPVFESRPVVFDEAKPLVEKAPEVRIPVAEKTPTKIELTKEVAPIEVEEVEEFDDRAPFAMRFNSGLFDLIIGSFASLILLSPFILIGGNWLSVAGIFAFLTTCSIVMFMYLTTTIGLYGRTLGMRLFSLEILDVESEDYPTFHQAAVNSAVYLLSLALGGAGFLTMLSNEDRRAVHDLVSGTIIVREE